MTKRRSKKTPTRQRPAAAPGRPAVDPKRILEDIAADPEAPIYSRVAAAKALLAHVTAENEAAPASQNDRITALAVELLRTKK